MRKSSKKALSILCTIAMIASVFGAFGLPAQEAEAGVTEGWYPDDVTDDTDQRLGWFDIEIQDIVDQDHEAYIELPAGFEIDDMTVYDRTVDNGNDRSVVDGVYITVDGEEDPAEVVLDEGSFHGFGDYDQEEYLVFEDASPKAQESPNGGVNTFGIKIYEEAVQAMDTEDFEIRISFDNVWVPDDAPDEIYADITRVAGQFTTDEVLIGVLDVGEIEATVRDLDHFADEGEVEIRLKESMKGVWEAGEDYTLELPRGFIWDVDDEDEYYEESVEEVFGDPATTSDITFTGDGERELSISLGSDDNTSEVRTAFDFEAPIKVERYDLADEGDIVAEVGGGYDYTPDELVVGRYGDYYINILPEDVETVYAGETGQEVAEFTLEEEIANSLVPDRSVVMELPDGVWWQAALADDDMDDVSDDDVELEFTDFINNRTARFMVRSDEDLDRSEAEELVFEDVEVAICADFRGDIEVEFSGTAGVDGTAVVADAIAPASMEVPEMTDIYRGKTGQEIGDIYITEEYAGAFDIDENIELRLDRHVEWEDVEVEVEEGDIELGTPRIRDRNVFIEVTLDSDDDPSTIKVSGEVKSLDTIPYEDAYVELGGSAVVDYGSPDNDGWEEGTPEIRDAWYLTEVAYSTAVKHEEPAPVDYGAERVDMWVDETRYEIDGMPAFMDLAPFIEDDRTFVPVRFLAEAFGAEADWEPKPGPVETVILDRADVRIIISIGEYTFEVYDKATGETETYVTDVAAQIVDGRTVLPFRAIGEDGFGADVDYSTDPDTGLTDQVWFEQDLD